MHAVNGHVGYTVWYECSYILILFFLAHWISARVKQLQLRKEKKNTAGWKRCNGSSCEIIVEDDPTPSVGLHSGKAFLPSLLQPYAKWYLTFVDVSAAWLTRHFAADWNISTKGWISVKLDAAVKIPRGSSSLILVATFHFIPHI